MGSAKSKSDTLSLPAWAKRLGTYLKGPGRPLSLAFGLVGVFLLAWYTVWREVRASVLSSPDYFVGPQDVEISPPPEWIRSDIRAEVFRSASLDGRLSIMDDTILDRIRGAFSLHPWIAKVRRVSKHHPAKVRVELEYRQPVLMVEAPDELLPVDAQGIVLPRGDFSPVEKSRFPKLTGVNTGPLGAAGERWGDARVAGAAEIAGAIGPAWQDLKLAEIVPAFVSVRRKIASTCSARGAARGSSGAAPGQQDARRDVGRRQALAPEAVRRRPRHARRPQRPARVRHPQRAAVGAYSPTLPINRQSDESTRPIARRERVENSP